MAIIIEQEMSDKWQQTHESALNNPYKHGEYCPVLTRVTTPRSRTRWGGMNGHEKWHNRHMVINTENSRAWAQLALTPSWGSRLEMKKSYAEAQLFYPIFYWTSLSSSNRFPFALRKDPAAQERRPGLHLNWPLLLKCMTTGEIAARPAWVLTVSACQQWICQ